MRFLDQVFERQHGWKLSLENAICLEQNLSLPENFPKTLESCFGKKTKREKRDIKRGKDVEDK
jgi:hypothetical protein